ncbi:MAG TPA: response regulator [Spirochaetia bacterium]|nr:response regulator [Spirochaetia bacterium]
MIKNRKKKVRIFSALEVANICGVVNQTAINWIKSNYLKAFMTPGGQYRVYSDDLYGFLKSRDMRIPLELQKHIEQGRTAKKLLIVEDELEVNDILKRFFEKKKPEYQIYQAFDGFEAGKLLTEINPGIVILDINLPGIDGYRLCSRIKSDPSLGSPLIIAITGLSDPDVERKIRKEGADAFFTKPFEPTVLSDMIDQLAKKTEEK